MNDLFDIKFTLDNGESYVVQDYGSRNEKSLHNELNELTFFGHPGNYVNLNRVLYVEITKK